MIGASHPIPADRENWLNGWHRHGHLALIGSSLHCVGCGKDLGIVSIALESGHVYPEKDPAWPFTLATCPVCGHPERAGFDAWPPRMVELYVKVMRLEAELKGLRK